MLTKPSDVFTCASRLYTFGAFSTAIIEYICWFEAVIRSDFIIVMKLFLHFIEAASEAIDTCIAQSDNDLTLKELVQLAIVDYRRDIAPERVTIYKTYK